MAIGLRVEVEMDLQVSILVRTITNVVKFLAVYFLEAFKIKLGIPLRNIQQRPCRSKQTAEKTFSNYGILHKNKIPERRTGLLSAREGNLDFLAIEDELFAAIFVVRQFHHEYKFLTIRSDLSLPVQKSGSTNQNRVTHRPLGHARLKTSPNCRTGNRIQVQSDKFISIGWWIRSTRIANQNTS